MNLFIELDRSSDEYKAAYGRAVKRLAEQGFHPVSDGSEKFQHKSGCGEALVENRVITINMDGTPVEPANYFLRTHMTWPAPETKT